MQYHNSAVLEPGAQVMKGSLAQLVTYWLSDKTTSDKKELAIIMLETIRDDFSNARLNGGRLVTDMGTLRDYLDEQIAELRAGENP